MTRCSISRYSRPKAGDWASFPKGEPHGIALERSGHVPSIDAERLGLPIIDLGGGRKVMSDAIDHAVGLEILAQVGDFLAAGQPAIRVFAAREEVERVRGSLAAAFSLSDQPVPPLPLIVERME